MNWDEVDLADVFDDLGVVLWYCGTGRKRKGTRELILLAGE
jgi:hypothetical protein